MAIRDNLRETIHKALTTGFYNPIIQPVDGIYSPEELYDILEQIPGPNESKFHTIKAPLVKMTPAQHGRIVQQCTVTGQFLTLLNARDKQQLEYLEQRKKWLLDFSRHVKTGSGKIFESAHEIAETVEQQTFGSPKAKTVKKWCATICGIVELS